MIKTIKIACDTKDQLSVDVLEEFQGELKSLSTEHYEALKNEIIETGFAFPIYVWDSPEGRTKIVGGHQRVRVLKKLRDEGYDIPRVPIVYVYADSEAAAKRRVLQDASQYGTIERQGLYEFMVGSGIDMGDLASSFVLPEINVPSFGAEFFMDGVTGEVNSGTYDSGETSRKEAAGSKEISEDSMSGFAHQCPRCGFHFD